MSCAQFLFCMQVNSLSGGVSLLPKVLPPHAIDPTSNGLQRFCERTLSLSISEAFVCARK